MLLYMNRKRGVEEMEDKITLDFETPETLRDSYVKSLKEWNEGIKKNQDMMNIFTLNKVSFLFLVLLGLLAYARPEIMSGLTGEDLNTAKTAEMRSMVQEGLPYDVVVKNVEEFATKVSQMRFSFQGGQLLTANEILDILKENSMLQPFIMQMESVFGILRGSFNEVKGLLSSSYSLLDDLSKGNINRRNIGDFVGYGIWSAILYIGYKVAETSVNVVRAVGSRVSEYGQQKRKVGDEFLLPQTPTMREYGLNSLMHLNIDGEERVVFLSDILDTINTRPPQIVGSFFDLMLAKLFEHQEAWTDIDDDYSATAASTVASQITAKSSESIQRVSSEGYGGEFERMAEFINTHMGSTITQSGILLANGFTNLYAAMLNITCISSPGSKMETHASQGIQGSQGTQETEISEITMSSLTRCNTYKNEEIDTMTYSALTNTFSSSIKRLFGKEGGRRRRRKTMKRKSTKRRRRNQKKRTMRRRRTRRIH